MIRPIVFAAALATVAACTGSGANAQNFNGTCPRVWRQGPILYATCLNAYGALVTSSIDASSCPPEAINNANGQLVCTAGSGGGYGYGPPRRYRPYGYGY